MIFSRRLSVTGVDLILRPRSRAARLSKAAAEAAAAGDSAAAEAGWRKALALREAAGAGREQVQRCDQHALAALLVELGRRDEAEPLARAVLDGPEIYCNSFTNLAWVLWRMGRDSEAEAELDAGLATMRAASEPGDLVFLRALDTVATACRDEGNVEAAREHFRQLCTLLTDTFGPTDPRAEAAAAELAALASDRLHDPPRLQ